MASAAKALAVEHLERRRSERMPSRVRLVVYGYSAGERFEEETFTISENAHGALLALRTKVSLGQRLVLSNPRNWDEREARVSRSGMLDGQRTEVAIEFAHPAPEFWPAGAPPKKALPQTNNGTGTHDTRGSVR
jgi:hypothetical protein